MGRTWHSPSGVNLYTTIILRPPIPLADVPRMSLVAGVAAAEALEREAPGIVALKWPNDVWLRGRKAGGIIAEAVTDARQNLDCVLLGIGININLADDDIPPELRDKATSMRIATGHPCDRIAIANSLFNLLDSRYMETLTRGFEAVRPSVGTLFRADRQAYRNCGRRTAPVGSSQRNRRDRCTAARHRRPGRENRRRRGDRGRRVRVGDM